MPLTPDIRQRGLPGPWSAKLTTWLGEGGRALTTTAPPPLLTCASLEEKLFLYLDPWEQSWQWLTQWLSYPCFYLSSPGLLYVCVCGRYRPELELKLPTLRGRRKPGPSVRPPNTSLGRKPGTHTAGPPGAELGHTQWHDPRRAPSQGLLATAT